MIRIIVLMGLLLAFKAHAEPSGGFDSELATNVYTTALTFMAPRVVDPVPVSKLTQWGLRGLSTLDPRLTTELHDTRLRLLNQGKSVFETGIPKDETITGWVGTIIGMTNAAISVSSTVRRTSTTGIVQSFFDALCSHLDPYSRYIPPDEAGDDRERRSGRAGIGLSLTQRDAFSVVTDVIRDSPAASAGVRPGDTIIAVDGAVMKGRNVVSVSAMIEGPEDTSLTLTWKGRDGKTRESAFVRVMVPPETVFGERAGNLLLIRIAGFNDTTDTHLAHTLQDGLAGDRPPDGIVLDLRNNRGGLLRQAVTVADTFLPDGLVASSVGRAPAANHIWNSTPGELAEGVPLVILVDGRTASAAEVLAAALADRGRAVVVGSSTVGKGLVQTITPLPDGGELYVTWSRVIAPRGWPINGLGVMPQVCTSLGDAAVQRQLGALSEGDQPLKSAIIAHRTSRAPLAAAAIPAVRNACPAAEGRGEDLAVARSLINDRTAYATALLPPLVSP